MLPTLHVLAPFHTPIRPEHSLDPFVGLTLRFARMMRDQGYRVVEYSAGASASAAQEHVVVLDERARSGLVKLIQGDHIGAPCNVLFAARLLEELASRVRPNDIVCHMQGLAYQSVLPATPQARHIEPVVGYDIQPFGLRRVFPSQAWRHRHFGRFLYAPEAMAKSAVIPHFFNVEDWSLHPSPSEGCVLFAGRLHPEKLGCLAELVRRRDDLTWLIAGVGDDTSLRGLPNVELIGLVQGVSRSSLYGSVRAIVCPTTFPEAFGCVAIEAGLCGTPVVAQNYGAYTETVEEGVTGCLVNDGTLDNWSDALDRAMQLRRSQVQYDRASRYSLSAIGPQYKALFDRLPARV